MPSTDYQTLDIVQHHNRYPAIDPLTTLKGSASEKVIFISGASQGIGLATAVAFTQAGARAVYLTARSQEALKRAEETIRDANPRIECFSTPCDVTDEDQVRHAIDDCVNRFGALDAIDTCAGYLGPWKKFGESDTSNWWKTWEVNIKGTYLVARYGIPHLINSAKAGSNSGVSGGHLILVSSVGAQLLTPGASDYQTSKHAINRLCEFIDSDHAEDGIKCFAVHPGGVATSLAKQMPESVQGSLIDEPELGAGFAVWLCSGQADWASGRYLSSNWDVDELTRRREEILRKDLLVNRLRTNN